ncbi:hypothetical protein F4777DRAFT_572763 [Nemania sp. FL0916]|nr:hypothetical protein F4777DRAFT_572763 [Nemania sp. FL0916]
MNYPVDSLRSFAMFSCLSLALIGLLFSEAASATPITNNTSVLISGAYTGYSQCNDEQKNKIIKSLQDAAILARRISVDRSLEGEDTQTYRSSPA